ncbi:hypothetical protein NKG94_52155 [Micromonospora sp. M12]
MWRDSPRAGSEPAPRQRPRAGRHGGEDRAACRVDPKRWRQAGGFGTDGDRTYRLEQTGWKILADVHVQLLAERVAAVDPDFPERDEDAADDSREAGADVSVAVVRAAGGGEGLPQRQDQ